MTKVLTRARRHWRLRSATALAAVGALVATGGLVMLATSPAAVAEGQDHVFVCKYVGKPGVDEVLKEGKQPIYTAVSSIQQNQWDGITMPAYFSDAQDRSYVLDWATEQNTGQGETYIGTKTCPAPDNPNYIDPPGAPSTTDPCGPANIYFNVPEDTAQLDYTVLTNGDVSVKPIAPYVFKGASQQITFPLPADSGVPCEGDQEIPVPAMPAVEDPCDPRNIHFVVPADTDQLDWTLLDNGNVTVAPKPGFKFPGASQLITFQLPADSNVPCQPARPDPITQQLSDERTTCELGVESRTGTQTTTYVWNAQTQTYDAVVGPQVWGSWTFVRDLTDAEFEALDCRPDQPEPVVVELIDERMGCDIDVQGRDGTQTTSYVWNAATRDYDAVVGPEVWGDWVKLRDLTAAEAIDLDCIAGEETVVPKPQPKPEVDTPDREPAVLGTEAAVPTAVAAGLGGDIGATTSQRLGHGLIGAGGLALVAAGWLGLARRTRGVHEG